MKKTIKRILIGFAILVGIFLLIAIGFGLKFYSETRGMTPAGTAQINDSVFSLKDKFVNVFAFKHKNGFLLVDAGFNEKSLLVELNKLNISPEKVTSILLTHTDGDHIGALGLFKNAKVYMHKDEEQMINGQNGKFFFAKSHWKYGPYILLRSNDSLIINGFQVKVIHTPGHTPGSCCFLINNTYLLVGDNVKYRNGKFEHFNNFFNMNTAQQEEAIKHLPQLYTTKYVLTGHYGIIKK